MIPKICPYCLKSSYSSYDDPEWICPYCGKNIGHKSNERGKIHEFLAIKDNSEDNSTFDRN
ncbi:hypothetical protein DESME_01615 [Desulfitobacterium metallireducens DSM 15288]|uniref:Uncharacterized protein n=1 Tax=Desulfitobacterium metallireducens DSM 15288 TaxID=871968 RepID=W0EC91_9FIRM|nr:hypothetical protein DESME_01615 [Desulfitobacterium metallireducens DSM 15288]